MRRTGRIKIEGYGRFIETFKEAGRSKNSGLGGRVGFPWEGLPHPLEQGLTNYHT